MTTTLVRRALLTLVAATLAALVLLAWQVRPALPWDTPPHADQTEAGFGFLAWVGFLILVLGLLERVVASSTRRPPMQILLLPNLRPAPRTANRSTSNGYTETAFPLIPKAPPTGSPKYATVEAVDDSQQLAHVMITSPAGMDAVDRATVAIALLGPVVITGAKRHQRRLRAATCELLCYLALRPHGAHRDEIVDALWPKLEPDRGKHELWRAVGDARSHLGDSVLSGDRDRYQLDHTQITTDIDQLEKLNASISELRDPNERLALLESALALFRGEPLAGTDYLWADSEIRRLHVTQLDLIEQTGRARLKAGDPAGALASAEHGIADDPCNERLARIAMRAEAALGLRNQVSARYEQLCRDLDEQFGLTPDHATRSLYRQLLGQDASWFVPTEVA